MCTLLRIPFDFTQGHESFDFPLRTVSLSNGSGLRFPPYPRREKNGALPPVSQKKNFMAWFAGERHAQKKTSLFLGTARLWSQSNNRIRFYSNVSKKPQQPGGGRCSNRTSNGPCARAKAVGKRTLLSWSSGKDSAWALYVPRHDPTVKVTGLFSMLNERFNRVSMHATRAELLRLQAGAIDLPSRMINLPDPCTTEQYDAIIGAFVAELAGTGTERVFRCEGSPPWSWLNKCSLRALKRTSAA